jgi:hypothetical protein
MTYVLQPTPYALTFSLLLASRRICSQLTLEQFKALLVAVPECIDARCYKPNPVYPYALEVTRRFHVEFAGTAIIDVLIDRQETLPEGVRWVEVRQGRNVGNVLPDNRDTQ